jgi:hypothetical protein
MRKTLGLEMSTIVPPFAWATHSRASLRAVSSSFQNWLMPQSSGNASIDQALSVSAAASSAAAYAAAISSRACDSAMNCESAESAAALSPTSGELPSGADGGWDAEAVASISDVDDCGRGRRFGAVGGGRRKHQIVCGVDGEESDREEG